MSWLPLQASTITDQDIDAILARGQKETDELNAKMKEYTENAMKFTMDGGFQNAYEYRDEDDAPTTWTTSRSSVGRASETVLPEAAFCCM